MSSSSPSRGAAEPPPPAYAAAEARDWAALPRDILFDVFLRLGSREIMLGAEFVCPAWRLAAVEEPALWRRVGMESLRYYWPQWWLWRCVSIRGQMAMKLAAIDRAAGQCEAFKGYCPDDYLLDLVQRAPSLKSLHIEHSTDYDSGEALVEALEKLTLLEDLQIHFPYIIDWEENMLQSVCEACPRLKKLVLLFASASDLERNDDEFDQEPIDEAIPLMSELHTLKLYDCDLSCKGLNAILDCCPKLETLHIDGYFNKREMDKELRIKCKRVKNLTLPTKVKNSCYDYADYYYDYSEDEYSDSEE